MRYEYLKPEERTDILAQHEQQLLDELRGIEREHYALEVEYRIASRLGTPDQERMDKARAEQAALDVRYAAAAADLAAFPQRRAA